MADASKCSDRHRRRMPASKIPRAPSRSPGGRLQRFDPARGGARAQRRRPRHRARIRSRSRAPARRARPPRWPSSACGPTRPSPPRSNMRQRDLDIVMIDAARGELLVGRHADHCQQQRDRWPPRGRRHAKRSQSCQPWSATAKAAATLRASARSADNGSRNGLNMKYTPASPASISRDQCASYPSGGCNRG